MRGLRAIVPPSFSRAPISARLYSSASARVFTPFSIMAKNSNASKLEDSGEPLPKLSPSEFRTYNRLAEQMDAFVSPESAWVRWVILTNGCLAQSLPHDLESAL